MWQPNASVSDVTKVEKAMPYAVLPARLRVLIPDAKGQELFRNVVNSQLKAGRSESVAMASAWGALQRAGYKKTDGKWVKKRQIDDDTFTEPMEAVSRSIELGLNGDIHVEHEEGQQAFYLPGATEEAYVGAIEARAGIANETPDDLSDEDTGSKESDSAGNGLLERTVSAIMQAVMDDRYAEKAASGGSILKVDDEQRIVWGWIYVSTEKGRLMVDSQGDSIEPAEMVKMANDFMLNTRTGKVMHQGAETGRFIHSFPLTKELSKAFGIACDREGWIGAMKVEDDKMWAAVKSGAFTGFSIGGSVSEVEEYDPEVEDAGEGTA